MQHIVEFAISLDDETIKKNIAENAEKEIIREIKQDIMNKVFSPSYYGANATANSPLSEMSMDIVRGFFADNKEAILDKAAEKLADKLARTKAGKAALQRADTEAKK